MSDRPNKYRIIVRSAPEHFLKRVYVPLWQTKEGNWIALHDGCTCLEDARTICELDANPDRVVAEFTL